MISANRYDFFEGTSPKYFSKHPNQHPNLYFNNLAPLSQNSKLEYLYKTISLFLGK
jgi:hypothetical protein